MTIHGNVVAKLILKEMATDNEGLVGLEEHSGCNAIGLGGKLFSVFLFCFCFLLNDLFLYY